MSRTRIMSILLTVLLAAAAIPATRGENAPPPDGQSANQASPPSSSGASSSAVIPGQAGKPQAGVRGSGGPTRGSGAQGSGSGQSASGQSASGQSTSDQNTSGPSGPPDGATRPPAVCFKLTGHCVDAAKSPARAGGAGALKRIDPSSKGSLNLAAPDVRSVIPADQLKEPLPGNEQIAEVQEADTVAVKGTEEAPDVPGGFGAIWWAIGHPSQAWRIFAPAQ